MSLHETRENIEAWLAKLTPEQRAEQVRTMRNRASSEDVDRCIHRGMRPLKLCLSLLQKSDQGIDADEARMMADTLEEGIDDIEEAIQQLVTDLSWAAVADERRGRWQTEN